MTATTTTARSLRRLMALGVVGLPLALGACSTSSVLNAGAKTPAPTNVADSVAGGQTTLAAATPSIGNAKGGAVVGFCPKVQLITNDETYRTYAGREREVDNIAYQAVLYDATRSCRVDGESMIIDVSAAGRLLAGPRGSRGGSLSMPIRIAVKDSSGVPYSKLETFSASIGGDRTSDQFVYRRQQIVIPATSDRRTTVLIGFDEKGV